MTGSGLKSAIITKMISKGFQPLNPATNGEAEAYIEALAEAVVEYIQANGEAVDPGGIGPNNHPIL